MMKKLSFAVLVACSILTTPGARAEPTPPGPSTRDLHSETRSATLTLDPDQGTVVVRLKKADGVAPGALRITFRRGEARSVTLELRALSDHSYTGRLPKSPEPRDNQVANQQSFVGVELRIPLSGGGSDLLR